MPQSRPLTPAGRRILDAAEELFYHRGITPVGVDLIAEHSGVTKRTLYNQFGSKDQLVAAYLAGRDDRWRALVRAEVEAAETPAEAVVTPLLALEIWNETNTRGCAFVNALAEISDPAHPAYRIAIEQKRWLRDLFADLATDAGCSDPMTVATRLLLLHEGALATRQLGLDTLADSVALARSLVS